MALNLCAIVSCVLVMFLHIFIVCYKCSVSTVSLFLSIYVRVFLFLLRRLSELFTLPANRQLCWWPIWPLICEPNYKSTVLAKSTGKCWHATSLWIESRQGVLLWDRSVCLHENRLSYIYLWRYEPITRDRAAGRMTCQNLSARNHLISRCMAGKLNNTHWMYFFLIIIVIRTVAP